MSPPNQPRQSLSAQLAPDYHDFVSDVSSNSNRPLSTVSSAGGQTKTTPSSTMSSTNRFLDAVDAVTGRNKQEQARARRANQPSFSGSAFASDNDNDAEDDDQVDDDEQQDLLKHRSSSSDNKGTPGANNSDGNDDDNNNSGQTPTPRLPPLSKSQVNVPDPSRPAYKLGAPLSSKPPRAPSSSPLPKTKKLSSQEQSPTTTITAADPSDYDHHLPNETSSLLGNNNGSRPRNPQGNGNGHGQQERWTNEGSRRRTPRYNGSAVDPDQQDGDGDGLDNTSETDSLRRPSRYTDRLLTICTRHFNFR